MAKRPVLLALWVCWLALELEVLLVSNYPIRTELRALVGLPLYHILLTFLMLAALVRWLSPQQFLQWEVTRFRPQAMLVHLVLYAGIFTRLQSLWDFSHALPPAAGLLLWLALALAFMASWLLSWLPFAQWGSSLRSQAGWLGWVLPVSLVAPYVAELASSGWFGFADTTFVVTRQILNFLYLDVVCDTDNLLLGTSLFYVEIQPGCSGYEGMGLIGVLICAYLWVLRKQLRFPAALVLIPLSMALAYACNILRLVALVIIGTEISPSIAMRGFHSQAGWLSFTVLGLALIGGLQSWGWFHHDQQRPQPENYTYPALPYLLPMAGLIFATMVVHGTTGQFPYSYPLKPLVGLSLLLHYLPQYRLLWRKPAWESVGVGVAVYFVWMALVQPAEAVSPYLALSQPYTTIWLILRVLGGVVVVPIVEELAFRGYLLRRIQSADFDEVQGPPTLVAYLLSSLAFGFLHSDWLAGMLAGLAYAWVSTRRGGLSNAIVAHSVTNLGLAIRAIAFQEWGLW